MGPCNLNRPVSCSMEWGPRLTADLNQRAPLPSFLPRCPSSLSVFIPNFLPPRPSLLDLDLGLRCSTSPRPCTMLPLPRHEGLGPPPHGSSPGLHFLLVCPLTHAPIRSPTLPSPSLPYPSLLFLLSFHVSTEPLLWAGQSEPGHPREAGGHSG